MADEKKNEPASVPMPSTLSAAQQEIERQTDQIATELLKLGLAKACGRIAIAIQENRYRLDAPLRLFGFAEVADAIVDQTADADKPEIPTLAGIHKRSPGRPRKDQQSPPPSSDTPS